MSRPTDTTHSLSSRSLAACVAAFMLACLLTLPRPALAGEPYWGSGILDILSALGVATQDSAASAPVSGNQGAGTAAYVGSSAQDSAEVYVKRQILAGSDVIDVTSCGITVAQADAIIDDLYIDPELYFVNSMYLWYLDDAVAEEDRTVTSIEVEFVVTAADLPLYRATFEEAYAAALKSLDATIPAQATDLDVVVAVHDWLSDNCTYYEEDDVDDVVEPYTAYGVFVEGKAVCDGYSHACELLLGEYGIPCIYVYSDEMNHSWNQVYLDGAWYHMDCTWDDNTTEEYRTSMVAQDSLLRGDDSMMRIGYHDWMSPYASPADYPMDRYVVDDGGVPSYWGTDGTWGYDLGTTGDDYSSTEWGDLLGELFGMGGGSTWGYDDVFGSWGSGYDPSGDYSGYGYDPETSPWDLLGTLFSY